MGARIVHNAVHRWLEEIEEAGSIAQVLVAVQDFLANLTPYDVSRLPEDCRPRDIHEASDIDFWNLRLAEGCKAIWGTDRDGQMLTEVAQIFLRASVKISRLADERHAPSRP